MCGTEIPLGCVNKAQRPSFQGMPEMFAVIDGQAG